MELSRGRQSGCKSSAKLAFGLCLLAVSLGAVSLAAQPQHEVGGSSKTLVGALNEKKQPAASNGQVEADQQVASGVAVEQREQRSKRDAQRTPAESNIANAKIQMSSQDMSTAAAHHGKSYGGKYYMYAEVPKKGAHKWGYKRGGHKLTMEAKESAHKGHVHGHVKWHSKKGKGSHKYEYKHYDHKKKKHHY